MNENSFHTNSSDNILVDKQRKLGSGAQANVYKAYFQGKEYAAKIFHSPSTLITKKLMAMIENAPTNLYKAVNGFTLPKLTWPIRLIYHPKSNEAVGYLMELIDPVNSFTLDYFYDFNLIKKLHSPEESALSCRLEIAANLSEAVAELHNLGHHCIDFKPQNIRVYKSSHAVTLIDCDGFSILDRNNNRYPAHLLSTDYISPEVTRNKMQPENLGEQHDLYALAVIIFQLLNNGIHPFQGIPKRDFSLPNTNDEKAANGLYPYGIQENSRIQPSRQSIHNCFPPILRHLFDRAFV